MDRLDMQTKDLVQENITKIEQLFPNCVTEYADDDGKIVKKVDMEMLARELQYEPVAEGTERYSFNWPYKFKTIREMKSRQKKMLRPIKEKSVDFDNTKNLYIEGDNLDAMLVLRSHYLNKIKLIYIDPPYNTGNDFVYRDDFSLGEDEFEKISGEIDSDGNRLFRNLESDGRYHTKWLNMMYPRLVLARDLLTEDGVIFISIDDNECYNLKKVCDEIFNSQNYVGTVIWERAFSPKNDAKYLSASHDFILVYAKNLNKFEIGKLPRTEEADARYKNPDNDPRGPWTSGDMTVKTYSAAYDYPITTPSGNVIKPTNGRCWFTSKERMDKLISEGRVWFGDDGSNTPRIKRYLCDVQQGMTPTTIWKFEDVGHSQEGRQEVKKLFGGLGIFDGPKPQRLMERILTIANLKDDSIIMDFFSGSASTAHAVLSYNANKKTHCKFILVQYPEKCDPESDAFKAGYSTICDIGRTRIVKAAQEISRINPDIAIDAGFRTLAVGDTCVEDVFYEPKNLTRSDLKRTVSYFKPLTERSLLDRLFQALPEFDLPFSVEFTEENINGKNVFIVNKGFLIACLETGVKVDTIRAIANMHPDNALFCNDSMDDDSTAINCDQIFNQLSPETHLRII